MIHFKISRLNKTIIQVELYWVCFWNIQLKHLWRGEKERVRTLKLFSPKVMCLIYFGCSFNWDIMISYHSSLYQFAKPLKLMAINWLQLLYGCSHKTKSLDKSHVIYLLTASVSFIISCWDSSFEWMNLTKFACCDINHKNLANFSYFELSIFFDSKFQLKPCGRKLFQV